MSIPKSVSNWKPSTPKNKRTELLEPNAKDHPETFNATNSLEQWNGKGGKPKGPFGQQGKNF